MRKLRICMMAAAAAMTMAAGIALAAGSYGTKNLCVPEVRSCTLIRNGQVDPFGGEQVCYRTVGINPNTSCPLCGECRPISSID